MSRSKKISSLKIWFDAVFNDKPYWRITYPPVMNEQVESVANKTVSKFLFWHQAKQLKKIFGGKIWIDYKAVKEKFK